MSSRPMRMCGELVAGVLGTKAGRPRPFPTTTQLGGGALTNIWGPKVDIVAVLGPQDHIISEDPVRRHFYLCQERLAIIRIERGHFVDGLIIKVCSNYTSVAHLAMEMKHLLAGEHPNAMDVTTRYKSAPKVVKLFVKHNCVRHIRSRAGSKTCFYHGAHHYT